MKITRNIISITFYVILLIEIIGCGNHKKPPSSLFFRKFFAPTVIFIIPDEFIDASKERIYLIHDAKNGINPPKVDGNYTYFFNSDGIIRIKRYESWLMKDTIIKAYSENKKALWITKIGSQQCQDGQRISAYVVAPTKEKRLEYFQNSNKDHRRLEEQVNM